MAENAQSASRKAWQFQKAGNISDMKLVEEPIGAPGAGEVQVAVKAIGLNFADVFTALGLYGATPKGTFVPGLEFCGIIAALPESNGRPDYMTDEMYNAATEALGRGLAVGDLVMGVTRFGAYASRINVAAHQLVVVPAGWSAAEGAAFMVQGLTSWYGLRGQGNMQAGHTVLIHSMAGGCGMLATAMCLSVGATPIGTIGSPAKVEALLSRFPELRREQIIVRDRTRFAEQCEEALAAVGSSEGFDVVLDAVSGDFFQPGYDQMARGGRYVVYGAADWTPSGDKPGWLRLAWQYLRRPKLDPMKMIGDNKAVMGFNLIWMFDKVGMMQTLLNDLVGLQLQAPKVGEQFPFEDAPSAVRKLQGGTTTGKVVLIVD